MSIHPSATIGDRVEIGDYVVIGENAVIGDGVRIGHHVVIHAGTRIGAHGVIGDLTVLGKAPASNAKMARKTAEALPPLDIGERVRIGANCVIYRGAVLQDGVFVGDLASVRERVTVGSGTVIGRNAIVELDTVIGRNVTIQTGCYITADMVIEDDVFIGPRCSTSNDKYMGQGNYRHRGPAIRRSARIGNNATLLPGIEIGAHAVVGAGAVITKSVPPHAVYVGNPGRPLHKSPAASEGE